MCASRSSVGIVLNVLSAMVSTLSRYARKTPNGSVFIIIRASSGGTFAADARIDVRGLALPRAQPSLSTPGGAISSIPARLRPQRDYDRHESRALESTFC